MRKFHGMEVNDLVSHIVHATDINHSMFILSYLYICCRTRKGLILRHISANVISRNIRAIIYFSSLNLH